MKRTIITLDGTSLNIECRTYFEETYCIYEKMGHSLQLVGIGDTIEEAFEDLVSCKKNLDGFDQNAKIKDLTPEVIRKIIKMNNLALVEWKEIGKTEEIIND